MKLSKLKELINSLDVDEDIEVALESGFIRYEVNLQVFKAKAQLDEFEFWWPYRSDSTGEARDILVIEQCLRQSQD